MLPVALTRYLTERHNALVETVDATLLMRGRELQRDATRDHVVASRFFTAANALNFDTEGEFVPYCEKQCVEYTVRSFFCVVFLIFCIGCLARCLFRTGNVEPLVVA